LTSHVLLTWLRLGAQAMGYQFRPMLSVGLLLAFALSGRNSDPKQPMTKCELDAERTYPEKTLGRPSPSIEMAHLIQLCMQSAGYDFRCGNYFSLSDNWACYMPSSRTERWLLAVSGKVVDRRLSRDEWARRRQSGADKSSGSFATLGRDPASPNP
jgi:hypothetical protein